MIEMGREVHILLVEDDEVDAEHIVRSFRQMRIANAITVVNNGIEALKVLSGEGGYERLPRPYIILLDINMPQMNGLEFLQALRRDPDLRQSVVFVLTTSQNDGDMRAAYADHVAGYFLKSQATYELLGLPTIMKNYWRMVEFPVNTQQLGKQFPSQV
jgi:CheY-like chemotaxis protein